LENQTPPETPLTIVVASTPKGIIGDDGAMPWRLGSDLARFKKMTMGGTLVMGRRTFDSIGRPLPGRQTVVITRQPDWHHEGVHTASSAIDAITKVNAIGKPGFIVGGGEIWLTVVWSPTTGDTRVDIPLDDYRLVEVSRYPQTGRDSTSTELQKWVKKKSVPKT